MKHSLAKDDVNTLFVAASKGNGDVVKRILSSSDDLIDLNCKNKDGAAPLHVAALAGHASVCERLLDLGASVNAVWAGSTPLHLAVSEGHSSVVAQLIARGANLNVKDGLGCSPLHIAALRNNRILAGCLLRAGADSQLTDGNGKTPAQLWNLSAHSPYVVQQEELRMQAEDRATAEPQAQYVTDEGIRRVFRSMKSFVSVPGSTVGRVDLAELQAVLRQRVDPMGVPRHAVDTKIATLLAPAMRLSPDTITFGHFSILWLALQREGFL